ncbi:MAG: hypothetical protein ACXAC5_02205 [Promethearchaeota archaeon]|jgi:hypothetical protein
MTRQRLLRRRARRKSEFSELKAENIRLKKMVARAERKAEHKCTDASCSLCDLSDPTTEPGNFPLDIFPRCGRV